MEIEKLTVYRAISSDAFGWYVWEIRETSNTPDSLIDRHILASGFGARERSGRTWHVACGHYWTRPRAEQAMYRTDDTDDLFWTIIHIPVPDAAFTDNRPGHPRNG